MIAFLASRENRAACGGVSRAAKGADCKSAALSLRRFESYLPHQQFQHRRPNLRTQRGHEVGARQVGQAEFDGGLNGVARAKGVPRSHRPSRGRPMRLLAEGCPARGCGPAGGHIGCCSMLLTGIIRSAVLFGCFVLAGVCAGHAERCSHRRDDRGRAREVFCRDGKAAPSIRRCEPRASLPIIVLSSADIAAVAIVEPQPPKFQRKIAVSRTDFMSMHRA